MDFDEWHRGWIAVAELRGHRFVRHTDTSEIDFFAGVNNNGHNGPKCERCSWACCMHCAHRYDDIPQCTGATNGDR